MEIRVLDKKVAELVAAGEVVERPASVVKELMENSVDAGASSITVELKNGGLTYLRVTDNGCGIAPEQTETAFLRHATSKISRAEDLSAIGTLGFRGEALASIAAVARTEMITKRRELELGCHLCVEGGEVTLCEKTGCPDGTTLLVRDLFYNVPARLKFMRKDVAEGNAVTAVVQRLALSHPEISVRCLRDGREVLYTSGNGRLYSALYSVMGKEFAMDVTEVSYEFSGIGVTGYVSKPYAAQGSRNAQIFFLNGRYVKSNTARAALEQAYKNTIPTGRFPACILNIRVPLDAVDVNIHPAKTEVRFVNEKPIFDAVYFAVKSALGSGDTTPTFTAGAPAGASAVGAGRGPFERLSQKQPTPEPIALTPPSAAKPTAARKPSEDDGKQPSAPAGALTFEAPGVDLSQWANPAPEAVSRAVPKAPPAGAPDEELDSLRLLGELFTTYVLLECGSRFYIMDKHAAHERALFEKLKAQLGAIDTQMLLSPISVVCSGEEKNAVTGNQKLLSDLGFGVEDFGEGLLIRSAPLYIDAADAEPLLHELAAQLTAGGRMAADARLDGLLHTAACKAAIKAGHSSDETELLSLAREVLANPAVRYCPHGRPVLVTMTKYELDKKFGRV